MKIILAGGSGFLGKALQQFYCNKAQEIVVLSRSVNTLLQRKAPCNAVRYVYWPNKINGDRSWMQEFEDADLIINLAGKNVNCRYNADNRKEILQSRIESTEAIAEAIRSSGHEPKLWINLSSATIYRHAEDQPQDELTGEIGDGFSVDVVKAWEETFFQSKVNCRKAALRTGIVLGKADGVMTRLVRLAKYGLGGHQGSGNQKVNWIHEADFLNIVEWIRTHENLSGVFNVVAPEAVSNRNLMKEIRTALRVPFGISTPEWLLEIGARLIGTETELVLKSRWVKPELLLRSGFNFGFPAIGPAMQNLTH